MSATIERKKILCIDGDEPSLSQIKMTLAEEYFKVIPALNGKDGLMLFDACYPDAVIMDIQLPDIHGHSICKMMRKKSYIPIIIISTDTAEDDKIACFKLGADDFIAKPFYSRELLARIWNHLRRSSHAAPVKNPDEPVKIKIGQYQLDTANKQLKRQDGSVVPITPRESAILSLLAKNAGKIFQRNDIVQGLWGFNYEGNERTIDTHIWSLRQKIETDPVNPQHLLTARGFGYFLRP
ncbi:MAG: response regulator transcription factor [Dehalococcoidales bacterium]|jgi:two-component system response regulator VicR